MNRIKKNYIAFRIAVLLSLLILVMSFSFSVGAVSNNESGKCGENVTWSLTGENGNLTLQITGNGAMYNYSQKSGNSNNTPWNVYKDYITNVIIHNGVTTIGDEAFSFCKKLKNVTIANSVLEIGHHAFQFCDGVSTISIPESVEKIGDGAFYACGELNDIVVTPNNRFYSSMSFFLSKTDIYL